MSDNNRSFAQALLEEHNKLREKYGNVAPLLLDTDLSSLAQKHSDSLAKKQSKLELSENENVGENLYFFESGNPEATYDAEHIIDFWLRRSDFDENNRPEKTSHFTQIVWKGTNKLGVGVSKAQNGASYIVAFYEPRGNITNFLSENVIFESQNNNNNNNSKSHKSEGKTIANTINKILKKVDKDKTGKISLTKTKKIFQLLNESFGTEYTNMDAKHFFEKIEEQVDGKVDISVIKKAMHSLDLHLKENINHKQDENTETKHDKDTEKEKS